MSISQTDSQELSLPEEKPKQVGKYFCYCCGWFFNKWYDRCPSCIRTLTIITFKEYKEKKAAEVADSVSSIPRRRNSHYDSYEDHTESGPWDFL